MVDTSSWIALFRNYPRKIHRKAWDGMDVLIDKGLLTSPLAVYEELSARQDYLLSWVGARPRIFFEPDQEMLDRVAQINGRFPLLNKDKKKIVADSHVIALAVVLRERGLYGRAPLVVTEESDSPGRPTKIPFVARAYGISCIRMVELLEREGLGARSSG